MKTRTKLILLLSGLVFGQQYSLEECVDLAIENKVTVESAELDVTSAVAGKKAALSGILPSVSFSGSATDANTSILGNTTNATTWSSGINMGLTLYDGGNTWRNLSMGNNLIAMAKETERLSRINVTLEVHQAYFALLKTNHLVASANEDLELATQQLDLVNHQFELGAVKKTDVLKAQVRLGQAKTSVISQNASLDHAKRELLNAMGMLNERSDIAIEELDAIIPNTPDLASAVSVLEKNSPSLKLQELLVSNQRYTYKNTVGSRLPSLSLSGGYNTSAGTSSDLIADASDNWTMTGQLSLSVPLFTGFQSSVRSQQAKVDWRTAENDLVNVKDDLIVQLRRILDGMKNYEEIIPILEEVQVAAEEDLKLAQERYALGATTILEVLDAQLSVTQARTTLINTTYDALSQEASLKALMGVLDSDTY